MRRPGVTDGSGSSHSGGAASGGGGGGVGQSSAMVRAVFSLAKKIQPCIVFFDEADGLCFRREEGDAGADRWEGRARKWGSSPKFKRSGRFGSLKWPRKYTTWYSTDFAFFFRRLFQPRFNWFLVFLDWMLQPITSESTIWGNLMVWFLDQGRKCPIRCPFVTTLSISGRRSTEYGHIHPPLSSPSRTSHSKSSTQMTKNVAICAHASIYHASRCNANVHSPTQTNRSSEKIQGLFVLR